MGPPHTPQINGVAERYNRTLPDRLKPTLKHSKLHQEFWTEVLQYAVWTINRSPTRTNQDNCNPYDLYTGQQPSLKLAHVFGFQGTYLVPSVTRKKLDDHSKSCIFLGVLPREDGYKVLDSGTCLVIKTRNARFIDTDLPRIQPPEKPEKINKIVPWIFPTHDLQITPAEDAAGAEPLPPIRSSQTRN